MNRARAIRAYLSRGVLTPTQIASRIGCSADYVRAVASRARVPSLRLLGLQRQAQRQERCTADLQRLRSQISSTFGVDILERTKRREIVDLRQCVARRLHTDGHSKRAVARAFGFSFRAVDHGINTVPNCPRRATVYAGLQ